MNKLQTNYNGKMPFELDDIRWEQDAVRDAFAGLISAMNVVAPYGFKLSGCVVTKVGNTYTTTAGYICLGGEVLKVDAHSFTVTALHAAKWAIAVTYDPAGTEVFQDATTHETYEVRKGVLADTLPTNPISYMVSNAPYFTNLIFTLANVQEAWHAIGASGEPSFEAGWSNKGGLDAVVAFRKDNCGVVHIKGVCTNADGHGAVFTLPTDYRPSEVRQFVTSYDGIAFISVQVDAATGFVFVNTLHTTDLNLNFSFPL